MVVTISPSFSLYRMVVLPAASSPTWGGKGEGVGAREGKREQKKNGRCAAGAREEGRLFFRAGATGGTAGPFHPSGAADRHDAHVAHGAGGEGRGRGCAGGARREEARRAHAPPPPAQGKRPPPPPGHAPAPALPPRQPSPSAAHHQDPHFLLGEQPRKQLGEGEPHFLVFLGASDRRKKQKKEEERRVWRGERPGQTHARQGGGGSRRVAWSARGAGTDREEPACGWSETGGRGGKRE